MAAILVILVGVILALPRELKLYGFVGVSVLSVLAGAVVARLERVRGVPIDLPGSAIRVDWLARPLSQIQNAASWLFRCFWLDARNRRFIIGLSLIGLAHFVGNQLDPIL